MQKKDRSKKNRALLYEKKDQLMDKKIKKIEKDLGKAKKDTKALLKADKKQDKIVAKAKIMKKKCDYD